MPCSLSSRLPATCNALCALWNDCWMGTAVGRPPKMTTTNMAETRYSFVQNISICCHNPTTQFVPKLHQDERRSNFIYKPVVLEHLLTFGTHKCCGIN
jgi:hypothetical protein